MTVAERSDKYKVGKAKEEVEVGGVGEKRRWGCCWVAFCKIAHDSWEVFHHLCGKVVLSKLIYKGMIIYAMNSVIDR